MLFINVAGAVTGTGVQQATYVPRSETKTSYVLPWLLWVAALLLPRAISRLNWMQDRVL
jgi:hypothetical protein